MWADDTDNTCKQCFEGCNVCADAADNCSKCNDGWFLLVNKCEESCPGILN